MATGTEIAPHLPFLRRFLRALLGGQEAGDATLRRVVEELVHNELDSSKPDFRANLYRLAYQLLPAEARASDPVIGAEGAEAIAHRRMKRLPFEARAALLLRSLDGFDAEETSLITGISTERVGELVASALEEFERQTRARVLIIEDEPVVAMDIETIVRDLGHTVTAVAVTRDIAVASARRDPPSLILADIQLADNSSGIDAVLDIQAEMSVPVIYITAFPERLLTGTRNEPTFLITKPFQRSTVKAAIAQALFFDAATAPEDDTQDAVADELEALQRTALAPKAGPIDAQVVRGQLQVADSGRAQSLTDEAIIESVRKLHFRTAKHLTKSIIGSNAAPRLHHRLTAISRVLSRPLSREASVQLAIQTRGFERMVALVAESLDDATLADLSIFALDLTEFVRQFPDFRQFLSESAVLEPVAPAQREAALEVVRTIARQDAEVVDANLRLALLDFEDASTGDPEPLGDLAIIRTAGNLLRAIGRWVKTHVAAVSKQAGSTFDSVGGKLVGTALVGVLMGGPVLAAIMLLQRALPQEFAFLGPLIRLMKLLL